MGSDRQLRWSDLRRRIRADERRTQILCVFIGVIDARQRAGRVTSCRVRVRAMRLEVAVDEVRVMTLGGLQHVDVLARQQREAENAQDRKGRDRLPQEPPHHHASIIRSGESRRQTKCGYSRSFDSDKSFRQASGELDRFDDRSFTRAAVYGSMSAFRLSTISRARLRFICSRTPAAANLASWFWGSSYSTSSVSRVPFPFGSKR